MSKISLRWRITILMGILVLIISVLLTALSIYNVKNNFVIPLTYPPAYINEHSVSDEEKDTGSFPLTGNISDLPEGVVYASEVNMDVESARQSFSVSSYLYMGLVIAGSMIAAYYLAGRAMRPISDLNNEIEMINGNTLSKRVGIPQTKDEIESLSSSFNKLLERLEEEFAKEKRFSANAAHELKTPLATIMTSAQVLKLNDQTTLEEYRENLDVTIQSTRRLSSVIDGLLMLGRADREDSFEPVNISQILHGIQEEIGPLYLEKHITLRYDLNTNILRGNPLLLYRAFFNLIENAYKYTEKDGSITITSYCEGQESIICITDTGIGIQEEDIAHIFEPFYRADKSRSRKIAGAGLGLAITKEIIDMHKAAISITSRKGLGTVVEVRFKS